MLCISIRGINEEVVVLGGYGDGTIYTVVIPRAQSSEICPT